MQRTKYHRTYHLPWSFLKKDDKRLYDLSIFEGKDIAVNVKMDGENTSVYPDGIIHARSLDSQHNYTRDWIKRMASILRFDIPENHRFVFENVNYYHAIEYKELQSYAFLLSIWHGDTRISYDESKEYAALLDLVMPEELYRGPFDAKILESIANTMDLDKNEGYVVTTTEPVHVSDIHNNIAKFVRNNHVQPNQAGEDVHWLKRTYPNALSGTLPIKPSYMR